MQRVYGTHHLCPPSITFSQCFSLQIFVPPGHTEDSLTQRPFHVYDKEFLNIIGKAPTLTRIAHSPKDPLFHEAVVWYVVPMSQEESHI
jgi:gluconolactonase